MNRFHFWQRWLFIVCLILVIFGLALALFNQTAFFDFLFNNQINPSFWQTNQPGEDIRQFQQWIYGVLGATVAGWGLLMAFVVHYPFQRREPWAWSGLVAALSLWFVVDTALSLLYAPFNALVNSAILIAAGIPLLFTRKEFKGNQGPE